MIWQVIFALALASALALGRPRLIVWVAMLGNLAATALLAADPVTVAVFDLVAATLLFFGDTRAKILAMIFATMAPIYVIFGLLGVHQSTTYAIIDVLAFLQVGVISGADVGISRAIRNARRRLAGRGSRAVPSVAQRGHAFVGVAAISGESDQVRGRRDG